VTDFDLDGWPDFLVSRNNGKTLAFRNGGVAGRGSMRIELRGPAGNPTAIGARMTVAYRDGSTRLDEVFSNAGRYSQSSAARFVGFVSSNPPVEIRVAWPSGATGVWAVPAGVAAFQITA
jgi:hypothetical protein